MSMASGRAWTSLGQSLGNIGNLLLQNQERERERQRQAEQDALRADELVYSRGRDAKSDQVAEAARVRQSGLDAQARTLALAELQSKTGMAPTGLPTASPSVAGPQMSSIGAVLGAQPGFQKVGLSAAERTAQGRKDDAYNTMSSLASADPTKFGALPWKQQLNLAGDNTAYDNWRAIQTAAEAARRRSGTGTKTAAQLLAENRAQRDQTAQELGLARTAATTKYGPLTAPNLETAADTASFTADTADINAMDRSLVGLRAAGNAMRGGVDQVLGAAKLTVANQAEYNHLLTTMDDAAIGARYNVAPGVTRRR